MFALCQSMKWAHLPNAGGLYDQDPDLLDKFEYIFGEMAAHERAEEEKRKKKEKSTPSSARLSSRPTRIRNR